MIRDFEAYAQMRDAEYWRDLARMDIEDSIQLGEALLMSQVMDACVACDDDRPVNLARSLGIEPAQKV